MEAQYGRDDLNDTSINFEQQNQRPHRSGFADLVILQIVMQRENIEDEVEIQPNNQIQFQSTDSRYLMNSDILF